MQDVLDGYAAAALGLVEAFEALDPAAVYAPVIDLLPENLVRVADIGAGTGRDAAWFAARGHDVLAVEPVAALRKAGQRRHRAHRIAWLDDRLPDLREARALGLRDLVTLCGVWQHMEEAERLVAMPVLAGMLDAGGLLVLSLRHGPGAPGRRVVPVSPDRTIATAEACGLGLVRRAEAGSIQPGNRAAGVTWTWLALRRIG